MSVKIISVRNALCLAALTLVVAGCSPSGPTAFFKGKKYLDEGHYQQAAAELQTAATLLATNAAAWNYYGVALQSADRLDDAVNAYQRALDLNQDLLEARYNLGILYLQQNKPADAKSEFTAYTLRRPNDAQGWLKLGSAQLRLEETISAERSFSAVLALKTNVAEAYNGLGLARVQRRKPRDAAQFFAAALRVRPDYAAALLNLATVYDIYLHNENAALKYYRAYLQLKPRPDQWAQVNALVNNLEESLALKQAANAPKTKPETNAAPPRQPARPAPEVAHSVAKPVREKRPEPRRVVARELRSPHARAQEPARPVPKREPAPRQVAAAPAVAPQPTQMVQVKPAPRIITPASNPSPKLATTQRKPPAPAKPAKPLPLLAPQPAPSKKSSFWSRLFGSAHKSGASNGALANNGVTVLPNTPGQPTNKSRQKPITIVPPAPVNFPRYHYLSPTKPQPGNRRAASGAFTMARVAEQNEQWDRALNYYREAAQLDPSWFVAQYNAGVIAERLQNYDFALSCYEKALALKPDSADARYNFALTLDAAGYVPDAAKQLKKILATHPKEVRAHLALANICAQSLQDPAQARQQYLEVLKLDPNNPRAAQIRFWLTANPK